MSFGDEEISPLVNLPKAAGATSFYKQGYNDALKLCISVIDDLIINSPTVQQELPLLSAAHKIFKDTAI